MAREKKTFTVLKSSGSPFTDADVYIYDVGTTDLSTIYSTEAGASEANPITTDSSGEFSFFADNATYDIKVTKSGNTRWIYNVTFDKDESNSDDSIAYWDTAQNKFIGESAFNYNSSTDTLTVANLTLGSLDGVLKASSGVISGSATTSDLSEGSNLYYTNERVDDQVATLVQDSATITWSYNDVAGTLTASTTGVAYDHGTLSGLLDDDHTQYHTDARALTWLGTRSTSDLSEGTNLYYTVARVQANSVGGDVSGTISNIAITDDSHSHTNATITLASGDLSDGATLLKTTTNFAGDISGTYDAIVVANDSHSHTSTTITLASSNLTDAATLLKTTTNFGGDVSGTYNAIVVADNSHFHGSGTITLAATDLSDASDLVFESEFNSLFDTRLALNTTDNLPEGTNNLYYSVSRVQNNSVGGDVTGTVSNISVTNDSHNHTSTTITLAASNLTDYADLVLESEFSTRFNTNFATKSSDDLSEGVTNLFFTTARFNSSFSAKDTDDLSEGVTNFYYTEARFNTSFLTKDTGDLSEGVNLYHTTARVQSVSVGGDATGTIGNIAITNDSHNHTNATITLAATDLSDASDLVFESEFSTFFNTNLAASDTSDLAEGVNLYYTQARARTAISGSSPVVYDPITGIISFDATAVSHSDLTNLSNDDHTQYLLADGTRGVTGVMSGISPTASTHLATKGYVDSVAQGIIWRNAVIDKDLTSPPSTPLAGDRYIIAGIGGAWSTGTINDIAEYDGSSWDFVTPVEGYQLWVQDENLYYSYTGTAWTSAINALAPTQTGNSGKYLKTDGSSTNWSTITESDLTLSDVTTNNSSTSAHGFLPKLSGSSTQYLDGNGNFSTPAGVVNTYTTQAFSSQTSVAVVHSFGVYPIVQVLNSSLELIVPASVTHDSVNQFTVTFTSSSSGTIIASVGSPQQATYTSVSGNYTVESGDRFIGVTASGATITLLTAVGREGQLFSIKNLSSGNVTVDTTSSQTIDDELTQILSPYASLTVVSDGSNWGVD